MFAVVVIGGMGSIIGAIVSGFALGLIEGLTKVFYPEASNTVIFVIMAMVLLVSPPACSGGAHDMTAARIGRERRRSGLALLVRCVLIALALVAPLFGSIRCS